MTNPTLTALENFRLDQEKALWAIKLENIKAACTTFRAETASIRSMELPWSPRAQLFNFIIDALDRISRISTALQIRIDNTTSLQLFQGLLIAPQLQEVRDILNQIKARVGASEVLGECVGEEFNFMVARYSVIRGFVDGN